MAWAITPATLRPAAARMYAQLRHLEVDGDAEGWPWAVFCAAFMAPLEDLYALLALPEDPWGPAFDPALAAELLPPDAAARLVEWLGQFAGVRSRADLPARGQRLRLSETRSAKRGSPEAIIAAARARAIGPDGTSASVPVLLLERVGGSPYHFAVTMSPAHVPDSAATRRDIEAETPAGRRGVDPAFRFDLNLVAGGTYDTLSASFATWDAVTARFATWDALAANPSGA